MVGNDQITCFSWQNLKLGIGVATYNRHSLLKETIEAIQKFTSHPYHLFVSDDGSHDNTKDLLNNLNLTYLSAPNRGIAWNKNRILYYLFMKYRCDIVILLEDDTRPTAHGWEEDWVKAAYLYGHVNLAPSHWVNDYLGGHGTVEDPFISVYLTGQCSAFSFNAFTDVGFMDTRFRRYGFEHVEHTNRFIKAGYGGVREKGGEHRFFPYLITSDMEVRGLDKGPDHAGIAINSPIYSQLTKEEVYRHAWRGDEEEAFLRYEMLCVKNNNFTSSMTTKCVEFFWNISTYNHMDIFFNPETAYIFSNTEEAHGIKVFLGTKDGYFYIYFIKENERFFLKTENGIHFTSTNDICNASYFSIAYAKENGFGLKYRGLYLCQDLTNKNIISFCRTELNDWETFLFKDLVISEF
ncbi:glycosyltransferase family 2 protein [Acetobacter estunensis]|uniref:glycosyltransferase family 2 protein n=1 Tax=Acetobacter estunensis TaxID=104097 RepID=UPI001C2D7020|nr:glycosyltransferase [Acetobacter estunensis]MBV1836966.1 glycosyltransferase [Acetobacter estunensis]